MLEKIENYNAAICSAPPRLYDLYVSLYLDNQTQDSLSEKLGYTIEYISRLNTKLVKYLQKNLKEKEEKQNA
jgi:DNA-dependent RNA polymerase auxiliary subunit epsilon